MIMGELNTDCMKYEGLCVDIFAMVQMLERVLAFSEENCTTAANQQILFGGMMVISNLSAKTPIEETTSSFSISYKTAKVELSNST